MKYENYLKQNIISSKGAIQSKKKNYVEFSTTYFL